MRPSYLRRCNKIMREIHPAEDVLIDVQKDILRIAKERGMSPKRIAARTKLNEHTIISWSKGSAMPAWAFAVLTQVLDDDLSTLMFEQFDKFVGTADPSEGDLDSLGNAAARFVADKLDSETGGTVTPMNRAKLQVQARQIGCIAFSTSRGPQRRRATA